MFMCRGVKNDSINLFEVLWSFLALVHKQLEHQTDTSKIACIFDSVMKFRFNLAH